MFVDSNSTDKHKSLKVFLLNNKTSEEQEDLPPILILYSTKLTEEYDELERVYELIKYNQHEWKMCSDYKVMNETAGIGGGSHKHPCLFALGLKTVKVK